MLSERWLHTNTNIIMSIIIGFYFFTIKNILKLIIKIMDYIYLPAQSETEESGKAVV